MAGVIRNWRDQQPANSHGAVGWKVFTEKREGPSDVQQSLLGFHGFTYRMMQPSIREGLHDHANKEHVIYVIRGCGKVQLDDEIRDIKPGDSVHIPPLCKHQLINDSDDWLEHVLVSALVR